MSQFVRVSAACAALAAVPAAQALAADYDPPIYVEEAPEYVPVEIGSGWYLRGDVAYTTNRRFRDTRLDDSIFDANLVSIDPAVPLDLVTFSEKNSPVSGTVGVGYHVNDFLRLEANLGLLYSDKYSGSGFLGDRFSYLATPAANFGCLGTHRTTTTTETTVTAADGSQTTSTDVSVSDAAAREGCDVDASLRNSAWTGTVNAYADLGTVMGFTPYVGIGGGLLYTSTKLAASAQCNPHQAAPIVTTTGQGTDTVTTVIENNRFLCEGENGPVAQSVEYSPINTRHADYHLLYSLSAGVAYQLSQNTKLDVGYQFVDAPNLKGFNLHQVKVGLRYDLW